MHIMIYCIYNPETLKFFVEYILSIQKHYPLLLVTSVDGINVQDTDLIWVLQLFTDYSLLSRYPGRVYLINTEQVSRGNVRAELMSYPDTLGILDYSRENIRLLARSNTYYMPYRVNADEIFNYEKILGAVIVGGGDRRSYIAEQTGATLFGKTDDTYVWGLKRDNVLFRHRILINIHYSAEYTVLEELRIARCVFNKMIVISERSSDLTHDLRKYIIECEYDEIPDVVRDVESNYAAYHAKLFGAFDLNEIDRLRAVFSDSFYSGSNRGCELQRLTS